MAASLITKLQTDLITAMKAHDSGRVEALRFLLAAVKNYEIDTYPPSSRLRGASPPGNSGSLTDEDIIKVIQKQARRHRESIEAYERAGRKELAEKERLQLGIVESYLPKGLGDSEITTIVQEIVASGEKNFGKVMGLTMKKVAGRANGNQVSSIVKEALNQ